MTPRTTNAILNDIELYAELQRRVAFQNPDDLLGYVKELRSRTGYAEEYHSVTNSGIGLAKMALLRNDPKRAMECLQAISKGIDDAIRKFFPESAAAMELRKYEERENASASSRPSDPSHHRQVLPTQ